MPTAARAVPAALLLGLGVPPAAADVVVLKTGGEVRGEFVGDPRDDDRPLVVRTAGGAEITVGRAAAASWAYRTPDREAFERRFDRTADGLSGNDAADAWWELGEWALARRLSDERRRALEEVIRHAPRHVPARKGLGHVKDDLDGEWVSREEWRRKRGLVLYDGRAVSPEERALLAKADAGDAARRAWYRDVRRWHRDLRSPRKAGAARAELVKIDDPAAAEALRKFFADDPEAAVRSLMVTVLSRLPGDGPVPALADQAMRDVDAAVRGAAVAALAPPARRESAQPLLRGGLRSKENMTVRRSASALAEVGDARAVPDLIKSLVTTHYYKVAVPQSGVGMTTGPGGRSSFGGGGGGTANLPPQVAGALLTGQLPAGVNVLPNRRPGPVKVQTVKVDHTNPEVLVALRKLVAGAAGSPPPDGYDESAWAAWWELNGGAN